MSAQKDYLSLSTRVGVLLANSALFYVVFVFVSGKGLPTGGLESVWFLSGLALWLLALLSSPWFVPPRDALANAIGAICILVTLELEDGINFRAGLDVIRWGGVAFCVALVVTSLVSLFLHEKSEQQTTARLFYRLTTTFGVGEIFYTLPALISILGAYQKNYASIALLLLLWVIFVVAKPIEKILSIYFFWKGERENNQLVNLVGVIERIDYPNILRVKLAKSSAWKPGTLFTAVMPDGEQQFVIGLFSQVQGLEVMGTGLCVAAVKEPIQALARHVYATHDEQKTLNFIENLSGAKDARLIGFIVENSTISRLRFEVAEERDLAEGDVVFANIAGREIFYQILDAETAEESFDQNPRGTHIVRAVQLGCYDPTNGFTKYSWLPPMNTPLFWARERKFPSPVLSSDEFIIGTVPSTNIAAVASVTDLIEYHTAILGVTGTGKTEMALEIVREAMKRGVKIFCVDFTGEYKVRLGDLKPDSPSPSAKAIADLEKKLFDAETGAYGAGKEKAALDGSLKTMRQGIAGDVHEFLTREEGNLAILELAEIANSKATLRLTELYLSEIMNWARNHRKARQVLIVLEEAHTIIPETVGSGFDNGTQWVVGRIGQIALQGRKYGVGLLVVSQRTALVSKTILSQCNTFLTHSLIDQTSLKFLESVYSHEHARSIPNLGQFEFLAFGKALKTERPILLKKEFDENKKAASEKLKQKLPDASESKKAPPGIAST
jgi:hypothetical protein